jgi:hypothetical protein
MGGKIGTIAGRSRFPKTEVASKPNKRIIKGRPLWAYSGLALLSGDTVTVNVSAQLPRYWGDDIGIHNVSAYTFLGLSPEPTWCAAAGVSANPGIELHSKEGRNGRS